MTHATIERDARLSPCGLYRFALTRRWSDAAPLPFVMLNPSTADAEIDDRTIGRCMSFADREGAGGIEVANLFAWRATKPADLATAADPEGTGNQLVLAEMADRARRAGRPIVCAWGAHPRAAIPARGALFLFQMMRARSVCLGLTRDGHPRHPLYVPGDAPFLPYPAW